MLTSIENMLKHIAQRASAPLRKVIAEHVYIGAVNEELALLQFNTKMYVPLLRRISVCRVRG